MDREDWNKFVKVFNLDVNVTVKKEVSKSDVIMALLDEGDIAFRGKKGQFYMKCDKNTYQLIEKCIKEELNQPPKNSGDETE